MPTALLICMENTFWDIHRDGNIVQSFEKSFTLYVDSGIRKKVEAEIDMLRNEHWQGGGPANENFKAKFCNLIIEHYCDGTVLGDESNKGKVTAHSEELDRTG